jgi:NADP-dependent 3-hydroxy acid dehydrogenase YdfG
VTSSITVSEVAVVTGAGGMGVAVVRRIGNGRTVVLADYDEAALGRAAEQLQDEGHALVDGGVIAALSLP